MKHGSLTVNGLSKCVALTAVVAFMGLADWGPGAAAGQAPASPGKGTWSVQRTPWGDPDLQGTWNNTSNTPLERPADVGGKAVLTDTELAEREARRRASRDARPANPDDPGTYNDFWRDEGLTTNSTSQVVDPPDGRIPPLTAQAQQREKDRASVRYARGPSDSHEDRNRWERCLSRSLPMYPGSYNNNFEILQVPGYVAIMMEMIHEVRIIPLDGRPHGNVRQWLGDSRGRWEGDTLVVETTNFVGKLDGGGILPSHRGNMFQHRGSGETLRLVERFTRVAPDRVDYSFTMDDPATYVRPWTALIPMQTEEGSVYEYACHEGNQGLKNMLAGGRAEDARGEPDLGGGSWTVGRRP